LLPEGATIAPVIARVQALEKKEDEGEIPMLD